MTDDVLSLLREIRDIEKQHLAEYRQALERAAALQESTTRNQQRMAGVIRRFVLIGATLVVGLLILLASLLARWWPYLFR